MKLNQVIAISNGEKSTKQKVLSKVYQDLSKIPLFNGITKRYKALEDDTIGVNLIPDETHPVQMTVSSAIEEATKVMEKMFNIVATQDLANCEAKADVMLNNKPILTKVPVTHLLFLEKQLIDLKTFIDSLPVLDPAESWTFDKASGQYKSEPSKTIRSKKVMKNHVKSDATDKHPAQVEVYNEDVPVGTWTTIKFSGCIEKVKKNQMLDKIEELDKAVKLAREEANSIEVKSSDFGSVLLDYIFGDIVA